MWTCWVLASAVMLALYDLSKKASVRGNAVLPVLLISSTSGAVAYIAAVGAAGGFREAIVDSTSQEVALVAVKSLLAAASWVLTFWALRTLPITVATPIRATSPAIVFVAAFFLYGERPTPVQGLGMALVFAGYWTFVWAGRHEGLDVLRNRAVWLAVGGLLFSAAAGLWDKYILQLKAIPVERVQFWFQTWLVAIYSVLFALSRRTAFRRDRFDWRWTIPLTGVLLAGADWLYFHGIAMPGVQISATTLMRRLSAVVTFLLGAVIFRETNLGRKGLALAVIVAGVILLCL